MTTTNERIARWLGAMARAEYWANPREGIVISLDRIEFYRAGSLDGKKRTSVEPWSPDTDISLWHGPEGILAEIEKKWMMAAFVEALIGELGMTIEQEHDGSLWVQFERIGPILRSEPAQLSAALRKCIEKEGH